MRVLEMTIQPARVPTAVCILLRNCASRAVTVRAPNPYNVISIFDGKRKPYSRLRAVAWEHSSKICRLEPAERAILTVDLAPFWDDVHGDSIVSVTLDIGEEGMDSHEESIEGYVTLDIPSWEQKRAELKKRPRHQGPLRIRDVSESSQFEKLPPEDPAPENPISQESPGHQ
jgi:hypothetical protein